MAYFTANLEELKILNHIISVSCFNDMGRTNNIIIMTITIIIIGKFLILSCHNTTTSKLTILVNTSCVTVLTTSKFSIY